MSKRNKVLTGLTLVIVCEVLFYIFPMNIYPVGIWKYDSTDDWIKCQRQHCDILSGYVKVINIFDDEFNTNILNPNWNWINKGEDNIERGYYSLNARPGFLRLVTWPPDGTPMPYSNWWATQDIAPKIIQQVDFSYDFEIETFTYNPSAMSNDEAHGLFIRDDSLNAIVIDQEFNGSLLLISWRLNNGVVSYYLKECNSINYEHYQQNRGTYFKISKIGNKITTYYRLTTSTPWVQMQEYNNILFNNPAVGLFSKHTSVRGAYSDFDYFYYYGPKTFTSATLISNTIDLKTIPKSDGTIRWLQNLPNPNTKIDIFTQTSDDGIIWSEPWMQYNPSQSSGTKILSEKKRYIRFRVDLYCDQNYVSPELYYIEIEYPDIPPSAPVIISPDCVNNGWMNKKDISFTWSGADSNGVTVNGYFYSIDSAPSTNSAFTNLTYINITNCSEGLHSFNIIARADWENNSLCSEISTFNFGIDFTPPSLPSVISSSHPQFTPVNDNNFSIKISSSDSLSGIAGYSYSLSTSEIEPDNSVDSSSGEIYIPGLNNGDYIFKVKAIDNAGNSSAVLTYNIKVDYKNNVLDKNSVKVYPTISDSEIKIAYKLNAPVKKLKVEIKDSSGKTIKNYDGNTSYGINEIAENVSDLANGVYFIKLRAERKDGKEDIVIKKFLVKK